MDREVIKETRELTFCCSVHLLLKNSLPVEWAKSYKTIAQLRLKKTLDLGREAVFNLIWLMVRNTSLQSHVLMLKFETDHRILNASGDTRRWIQKHGHKMSVPVLSRTNLLNI